MRLLDWVWKAVSHPELKKDSEKLYYVKVRVTELGGWCSSEFPDLVKASLWVYSGEHPEPYTTGEYTRLACVSDIRDYLRRKA